jgi:DNA-binding transcriptional LysR family regulator
VDRTTRRVRSTDAGDLLVARARRALAELDAARAELDDLAGMRSGRVVIGVTASPGPLDVAGVLRGFHTAHPGVELAVREELSTTLVEWLRSDVVDVAFITALPETDAPRFAWLPVATEKLVLAVPPSSALARRRRVGLDELADERFIAFRPGATIRRRVERAARALGVTPRVAFETNEVNRARAVVAAGLAVAVLPHSDATAPGPRVSVVALRDPALIHEVFVAWRAGRHHSPAARAFIESVEASLEA